MIETDPFCSAALGLPALLFWRCNPVIFLTLCLPPRPVWVKRAPAHNPSLMISMLGLGLAIGVVALALIYPQSSYADGFTGEVFATWSTPSQDSYIQSSMTMAGVVLTQTDPSAAECLNTWYAAGSALAERNDTIRDTIIAYGEAHPAGVMMALILKECGPLN